MKTKFRGTASKTTRIGDLIVKVKKQESSAKAIEIKLNGQLKVVKEVYIIK